MRFRLRTILWAFAVFASAIATFDGYYGTLAAAVVCTGWTLLFYPPPRILRHAFLWFVFAAFVVFVLLLPGMQQARESSRRTSCINNLKNIGLALQCYNDRHGALPPVYNTDDKGTPTTSWRTQLPSELEFPNPYRLLRYQEPWNSSFNSPLTDDQIAVYQCPKDLNNLQPNTTSYYAIVDERTVWPGARARRLSDITDRRESTIVVIEASGKNAPWAKPEDLTFDEAVDLLCGLPPYYAESGHWHDYGFFYKPSKVLHVGFADGSARAVRKPLDRDFAAALLTCNGGEEIDLRELDRALAPELDYAKVYATAVFVILALLPATRWLPSKRPSPASDLIMDT
ncbi:MAG: DUF1559 domain-containing protein [Planctomycetota bacterium]